VRRHFVIDRGGSLRHRSDMGLYDRDYMRGEPPDGNHENDGINRLSLRRRKLMIIAVIILLAGFVLALVF
jgi:hypothetical protein